MFMAAMEGARIHHMKVTSAGQVSVPADVRRRWGATRVRITDEGDRLIVEPESDNPFDDVIGLLADGTMSSDDMVMEEREAASVRDARKWGSDTRGAER